MAQKKTAKKAQAEGVTKGAKRPSDDVKAKSSGKKIKPEPQKAPPPPKEDISPAEEDRDEEVPVKSASKATPKKATKISKSAKKLSKKKIEEEEEVEEPPVEPEEDEEPEEKDAEDTLMETNEDEDEASQDDGEDEDEGTNGVEEPENNDAEDDEEEASDDEKEEDDEENEPKPVKSGNGKEFAEDEGDRDESDGEGEQPQEKGNQDPKQEASLSLFVGNLPFTADEDMIRDFFSDDATVKEVRIGMRDGRSRGFCHVDFATERDLLNALRKNGKSLAGRAVSCDIAAARGPNRSRSEEYCIFVKNFDKSQEEATIRDQLTELFKDCGEVRCVRIPTDRDTGSIKGFAFVEFASPESISKAAKYHGTELGGRSIVVDTNTSGREGGGRGRGRGGRGGGRRGRGRRGSW